MSFIGRFGVVLVSCLLWLYNAGQAHDVNPIGNTRTDSYTPTTREQGRIFWQIVSTDVLQRSFTDAEEEVNRHAIALEQFRASDQRAFADMLPSTLHYNHLYHVGPITSERPALIYSMGLRTVTSRLRLVPSAALWLNSLFVRHDLSVIEAYIKTEMSRKLSVGVGCTPDPSPECPSTDQYRTYDGLCNNRKFPSYGKSGIPFRRFIPAQYPDGFGAPITKDRHGNTMPSARYVSQKVGHSSTDQTLSGRLTHYVMQWGQFLDHDITRTPMIQNNGSDISCCVQDNGTLTDIQRYRLQDALNSRPECFPILSSARHPDEVYPSRRCINFVRSKADGSDGCYPVIREQINEISAYVDGSMVYGSSKEQADALRTFTGGALRTQRISGEPALPTNPEGKCVRERPQHVCFAAGDLRVDEQPGLTAIHTVFVLEHNRIATQLSRYNPHWSDEKLYQETRKILIGLIQHITYSEFLPVVLGFSAMRDYDLLPKSSGYFSGYDPDADASLRNVFSTTAFRFGHSLIKGTMSRVSSAGTFLKGRQLRHAFDRPHLLYSEPDEMGNILRGLAIDSSGMTDNELSQEIMDHLFESDDQLGLDLIAFNIQRARDHGLPSYVEFRRRFFLHVPRTFDDLVDHTPAMRNHFRAAYARVEDLDVFIAGVSETPVAGAMVGPLFLRILATQFKYLKVGDRFFYENQFGDTGFSISQLNEIRKGSLAKILCTHAHFPGIQRFIFKKSAFVNPLVTCNTLPDVNLAPWKSTDCEASPRSPFVLLQCCRGRGKWVSRCKTECSSTCTRDLYAIRPCRCPRRRRIRCFFCRRPSL